MVNFVKSEDFVHTFTTQKEHRDTETLILMSDLHIDSPFCNRKLLKEHLDYAKEHQYPVFIFGDVFDVMQGRNDPRRSMRELKEIYKSDDYLDRVYEDVFNFLSPYRNNIAFVSYGNHEESVIKNAGIDLLKRLSRELGCVLGGFEGIIRLSFQRKDGKGGDNSFHIFYSHGASKNAVMTKGMLESVRKLINTNSIADVQVFGDSHTAYVHWDSKYRLTNRGVLVYNKVASIRLPSYEGLTPFMRRKGKALPLNGCVELAIEYNNGKFDDFYLRDHLQSTLVFDE